MFLEQGKSHRELTQLRTMKLLYYMQAASLVVRQEPLFNDPIKAWKYGPVVATVHGRYNGRREIVGTISQKDRNDFAKIQNIPSIVALLNKICVTYHNANDSELVSQTHNEMPWQTTDQSTDAKEKLEERGLLPSSIHDVKDKDEFWNQFL